MTHCDNEERGINNEERLITFHEEITRRSPLLDVVLVAVVNNRRVYVAIKRIVTNVGKACPQ